jgi:ABC-type glycerol-3-phosphate transport system permease component
MTAEARRPASYARREVARRGIVSLVLLMIAVVSALPLYYVVATSFKSLTEYASSPFALPSALSLSNFRAAWHAASIGTYMKNSIFISSAAVAISTTVAILLAFSITFFRWRGRALTYNACLILLAIPPLLLVIPIFEELARVNLINSYLGIIGVYAAFTTPFAVYLLVAYMRGLPASVVEAAVLDGSGPIGLLTRVVVPLSLPAIATASVFSFVYCWNEFIYAFILLQDSSHRTLPAGLASLQGRFFTDFPVLMAAVTLSVLPVIGLYVFFQRFLVRGIAVGVD